MSKCELLPYHLVSGLWVMFMVYVSKYGLLFYHLVNTHWVHVCIQVLVLVTTSSLCVSSMHPSMGNCLATLLSIRSMYPSMGYDRITKVLGLCILVWVTTLLLKCWVYVS